MNKQEDALVCHAFSHIKYGQFENCIKILYRFDKYHDYAYSYTDQNTLLFKIVLGYKLNKLGIKEIVSLLQHKSLLDLITPYQKEKAYLDLLSDVIELNTKIHQYHFNEKLKEILV